MARSFVLENENAFYVHKYWNLRPKNVVTNRFFLNYKRGKCSCQVIGKNKFLNAPKVIATFLQLENPQKYTGHSFRRTSATLLADAGADILTLKRHGGWRSSTIAEGYVSESVQNKRKIGNLICTRIQDSTSYNCEPSTSKQVRIEAPLLEVTVPTKETVHTEEHLNDIEFESIVEDQADSNILQQEESNILKQIQSNIVEQQKQSHAPKAKGIESLISSSTSFLNSQLTVLNDTKLQRSKGQSISFNNCTFNFHSK